VKILLLIVLALLIVPTTILLVLSTHTALDIEPVKVVGVSTPVRVRAVNPHGERSLQVTVQQDGKSYNLAPIIRPSRILVVERHAPPADATFAVGTQSVKELHDGKARIIITSVSNDLRGSTDTKTLDVDVMTAPPRVAADGAQHYINQGGAELVVFTPGGAWTEAGVKVGDRVFKSFPLPDHPGQYFSLFAFSWDLPVDTPLSVVATNPTGARANATFWYKVFPKKFRSSTIKLEDMHVDRIVNQIDPDGKIKGDLIERFVWINSEMRKQNNKVLADLRLETEPKFLWTGAFLPMVDSTVESRFADDRTYTWQGKKVDQQTHLGFDLAKVAHAPVPAANDGKVIFADNLGIYGNCIVIDHGFGLQTIYGHMSQFEVKKGDMVKKAQEIGRTGSTGLAGGDHLHFTMQVDGVQVNAVEWWDPHWIHDRILSKIGATGADAAPETPSPPHTPKRRRR
jgi:murein DD-endopeptidase MepM/ murein hydrolase activator NlpD